MGLAEERRNDADNESEKKPRRKEENASRQAGRCYRLLEQPSGRLNHYQTVRALNSGTLHHVVKQRLLVTGQVKTRSMLHNSGADVASEFVGQHVIAEIEDTDQNCTQAREDKFQYNQPPKIRP